LPVAFGLLPVARGAKARAAAQKQGPQFVLLFKTTIKNAKARAAPQFTYGLVARKATGEANVIQSLIQYCGK
jgi:hypothetical protein